MKKLFIIIAIVFINSALYSEINIDGFSNIKWGTSLDNVKGSVIGKISYTDEKKIIISKDGNIEYMYGFFFKSREISDIEQSKTAPAPKTETPKTEPVKTETDTKTPVAAAVDDEEKAGDSKLFFVSIRFPYIAKDDIKKKIEAKYGPATGEDLKDNKGAIVWNSPTTAIVMWVDSYEKKPFCMKINYFSKEIAKEVNNYQKLIFNIREIEILKKLSI